MLKILAAAFIGLVTATLSIAAQPLPPLEVVDQFNKEVGRVVQFGLMGRIEPNGKLYVIQLDDGALQVNQVSYYTTTTCAGTPYNPINWGYLYQPRLAQFDGQTLWDSDLTNIQWINAQSWEFNWNGVTGKVAPQCFAPPSPLLLLAAPAVSLETMPAWAPDCTPNTITGLGQTATILVCKPILTVR